MNIEYYIIFNVPLCENNNIILADAVTSTTPMSIKYDKLFMSRLLDYINNANFLYKKIKNK